MRLLRAATPKPGNTEEFSAENCPVDNPARFNDTTLVLTKPLSWSVLKFCTCADVKRDTAAELKNEKSAESMPTSFDVAMPSTARFAMFVPVSACSWEVDNTATCAELKRDTAAGLKNAKSLTSMPVRLDSLTPSMARLAIFALFNATN